ncbi:hypothetical protein GMRT_14070 [Giardia muris]|uniref:Uncharacterized protein n=1 Tax=Giardia muris TaxID=5742 RepID=A0A4Z1STM9_GIAMU|nr:hypothetical protein GMRT_14070 [Giardia muris]|eukprot:TNJ29276.1 hypothetical protein GMRT_14070 [Giardia muris]
MTTRDRLRHDAELASLRLEVQRLRGEVVAHTREAKALGAYVNRLKGALRLRASDLRVNEELLLAIANDGANRKRLEMLEAENARLRADNTRGRELIAEITAATTVAARGLREKQGEVEALRRRGSSKAPDRTEVEHLEAENARLRDELASAQAAQKEEAALRASLEAVQEDLLLELGTLQDAHSRREDCAIQTIELSTSLSGSQAPAFLIGAPDSYSTSFVEQLLPLGTTSPVPCESCLALETQLKRLEVLMADRDEQIAYLREQNATLSNAMDDGSKDQEQLRKAVDTAKGELQAANQVLEALNIQYQRVLGLLINVARIVISEQPAYTDGQRLVDIGGALLDAGIDDFDTPLLESLSRTVSGPRPDASISPNEPPMRAGLYLTSSESRRTQSSHGSADGGILPPPVALDGYSVDYDFSGHDDVDLDVQIENLRHLKQDLAKVSRRQRIGTE